jgi:hypothetical protein
VKRKLVRLPTIDCPHCQSRAIVRDSQSVTDMVRELRIACTNEDCGHTYVAQLAVIRTVRPSATPKKGVFIPFGAWTRPANDDHPTPDNDTLGIGAAIAAVMIT